MSLKFTFHAGALIAGQIKSEIQKICFERDLDCEIKKFGGWISSDYGVTITGDAQKLKDLMPLLQRWSAKLKTLNVERE